MYYKYPIILIVFRLKNTYILLNFFQQSSVIIYQDVVYIIIDNLILKIKIIES